MLSRNQEKRQRCLEAIGRLQHGGIEHTAIENADWDGLRHDLCRAFPSESEKEEDEEASSGEDSSLSEARPRNKNKRKVVEVISLLSGSDDDDDDGPAETEPQQTNKRRSIDSDSSSTASENTDRTDQSFDNNRQDENEPNTDDLSDKDSSDGDSSDGDSSDDSSTDDNASRYDEVIPGDNPRASESHTDSTSSLHGEQGATPHDVQDDQVDVQDDHVDLPFPSIDDSSVRVGDSGASDHETNEDGLEEDEYNIEGLDLEEDEEEEIVKQFRKRVRPVGEAQAEPSVLERTGEILTEPDEDLEDFEEIESHGYSFRVGKTYHFQARDGGTYLYGIQRLYRRSDGRSFAECFQVLRLEETFLGIQSTQYPYARFAEKDRFPLDKRFGQEAEDVDGIPTLTYEDYRGKGLHVCYYPPKPGQPLKIHPFEKPTLVDLFAGAGGMHNGFHAAGFGTAIAVEKNPFAAWTLSAATKNIFTGDVAAFLEMCHNPSFRRQLGWVWHLHLSPPCQGFSAANRNGGRNDHANNELSLKFVDSVKLLKPYTASYEMVTGILREAHRSYLSRIILGLIEEGYQVRCTILNACDYGDPQNRRRLIIFAARPGIELPRRPRATHGDPPLLPPMTVEDAIGDLPCPQSPSTCEMKHKHKTLYNTWYPTTKAVPGDPDTVVLEPHKPASTVRASSRPPLHYSPMEKEEGEVKYRCISLREAALLQSFPRHYKFWGPPKQQRMQVGNAVPVRLATAIARSVRDVFDSAT